METRRFCENLRYLVIAKLKHVPDTTPIHGVNIVGFVHFFRLLDALENKYGSESLTAATCQPLVDFLSQRWQVIANTDLIYSHAPDEPLNQGCIALAEELQRLTGVHHLRLLMPSLKVICNEITSEESQQTALKVFEFVMSDENDRVIEVASCLEFACDDNILKHTSLFDGQARALSAEERKRVIYHSEAARQFHDQTRRRVMKTHEGLSFGSKLNSLATGLMSGGVKRGHHQGASELNAGRNANEAISVFYEWLETLLPEEKQKLFACKAPELSSQNFGEIWQRLARPNDANYQSVIYCVELIAGNIRQIVAKNPWLLDTYSKNSVMIKDKSIDLYDRQYKAAKELLDRHLQSGKYVVTASYGDNGRNKLDGFMPDVELARQILEVKTINAMENNPDLYARLQMELIIDIARIIERAPDSLDSWLLLEIINFNLSSWARLASQPTYMKRLLHNLPQSLRMDFIRQIKKSGHDAPLKINDYCEILRLLTLQGQLDFITLYDLDLLAIFRNGGNEFNQLINNCMPENRWAILAYFCENFAGEFLNSDTFFHVMPYLTHFEQHLLIHEIYPLLPKLIQNVSQIRFTMEILNYQLTTGILEEIDAEVEQIYSQEVKRQAETVPGQGQESDLQYVPNYPGSDDDCLGGAIANVITTSDLKNAEFISMMKPVLPRIIQSEHDFLCLLMMLPGHLDRQEFAALLGFSLPENKIPDQAEHHRRLAELRENLYRVFPQSYPEAQPLHLHPQIEPAAQPAGSGVRFFGGRNNQPAQEPPELGDGLSCSVM